MTRTAEEQALWDEIHAAGEAYSTAVDRKMHWERMADKARERQKVANDALMIHTRKKHGYE